jgi:hypothetical protein
MRKVVKLNESDLNRIIKRILKEDKDKLGNLYSEINDLLSYGEYSELDPSEVVKVLENVLKHAKAKEYRHKNNIGPISKDEVIKNFRRNSGSKF